jgi:sugar-specific transcriptional regulator TrmB
MYEKFLASAGMSEKEAQVYEIMLQIGQGMASDVCKKSPFKRGLVYKILEQLVEKKLITKKEYPGKIALFRVEHPYKISEMLDAQVQKANYYKKSLEELMPQMISSYNLAFNRPGVKFYEGEEGVKKVLWDSLESKTEILTYGNMDLVVKYIDKINQEYVRIRDKKGLKKRALLLDSPFAQKYLKNYHRAITDIRLIDSSNYFFTPVMEIYDGKISYVTLSEETKIGVIIEDKSIYDMNRSLFNLIWEKSLPLDQVDFSKAQ